MAFAPSFQPSDIYRLLERLYVLRTKTYEMVGYDEPTVPGPPASETEIASAESVAGVRFPPSYRIFLSMHNGWKHWSGDVNLLSTGEMIEGVYADRIRQWKSKEWLQGNVLALEGLVIGFSLHVGEQIIVDPASKQDSEERDVILWDFEEAERYGSFYQYLRSREQIWEEELATEP